MSKTNAARLLDSLGITYELRDYDPGDEHLDAMAVAERIGMPPEAVFKTLVLHGDRTGVLLAVIDATSELDLKAAARASGHRHVELVALKEVQPLTGYVRGGVTALACKKPYPVFADELIQVPERISVSAGVRGTQIVIAPRDYLRATGAQVVPIARPH